MEGGKDKKRGAVGFWNEPGFGEFRLSLHLGEGIAASAEGISLRNP